MSRDIAFIALSLIAPSIVAFVVVFLFAFFGIDREASVLWNKAFFYTAGMIVGWWIWGAR